MNIHRLNDYRGEFFNVLESTNRCQVAVMTLAPGKDSGPEETHTGDQIVYVIHGEADVTVAGEKGKLDAGDLVVIPEGAEHHIYNNGNSELFFLTLYAPPQYEGNGSSL